MAVTEMEAWSAAKLDSRSFNPARLTLARERNGFTKQHFATLCNVSRRTVTAWEAGEVDSPPLELIAEVLRFPVSFFWADDPLHVMKEGVSFRALSTMTARQVDRVLAASALAVELSAWVDQRYRTPIPSFPDLAETRDHAAPGSAEGQEPLMPAMAAESLRYIWNLHQDPVRNLLPFLEKKGARTFSLPVDDREVDAFSFWQEDRPFIFLNTGKSAERMRFDLAHEVGHLLMHRGINTQLSRNYEQQAQDFAASFLVPADALYAQVIGTPRLDDIFKLKRYWKVSAVAMVHRLWTLSIISEWHYRTWIIELSQRGYRSSEPGGMHPEHSKLLKQVFQLAREDGLSSRRIASELSMPESELDSMAFGLAIAPAPSNAPAYGQEESIYHGLYAVE
jgi:Zn-dependent peptidase ImmA (M78 family)/DNA-binding XRE family transcriptional regulator